MPTKDLETLTQTSADELPPAQKPEFLTKLAQDNPELAERIEARLPDWKTNIQKVTGNAELADSVLAHIKYVSKAEIEDYVNSVAQEAQECLERGEQVVFLGFDKSVTKSNSFFYKQLIKGNPELEGNANYTTNHKIEDVLMTSDKKVNVFVLDDCSMSGSQMYGNLLWWVRPSLNGGMPLDKVRDKDIALKIRVMGAGRDALARHEQFEAMAKSFENPANTLSIDIETTRVPDVVDVVEDMGIVTAGHEVLFDFDQRVLWANHGMNGGTLIMFAHKIPDNTSVMLIEGNFSRQLGITPLLDKETEALFKYENLE